MKAYPAEATEAFLDGHVSAFAFSGGVPPSIPYDNANLAMDGSLAMASEPAPAPTVNCSATSCWDRFGRPGKGNDKAKVEG